MGEKISVCLLTYNHVHVIESTLESILNQSVRGHEIIVSDDCSTDGTWERIQAFATTDGRIRAVRTPHNMGMPGNANYAVAQTARPYVALLHHDDLYRQDLLEKWSELMERYADIALVFNAYGVHGSDYVYSETISPGRVDGRWLLDHVLFPRWGCPIRGTAMIRRTAWDQAGGMRHRFGLLSDIDLWMRLCRDWAIGYIPEPLIVVRQQRPHYYPDTYQNTCWSWKRQRYLYEVHAVNRLECLDLRTFRGRLKWWTFRIRLSFESIKWLVYAMVKRKYEMITTSRDSITDHDLLPLRLLRSMLLGLTVCKISANTDAIRGR